MTNNKIYKTINNYKTTNDLKNNNYNNSRPKSAGINRATNNVIEEWKKQSKLIDEFQKLSGNNNNRYIEKNSRNNSGTE